MSGLELTPHGFCLLWQPGLIWLHAGSDLLTGLAYFSIPVALTILVRRRPDVAFGWIFWLFAAFILACGATHFMSIATLWLPVYWLEGYVKLATAALSVATAIILWPLVPLLVALPSPAMLQRANEALREREAQTWELNQSLGLAEQIAHVGHWRISLPDRQVTWSDEMFRIHGVSPDRFFPDLNAVFASYHTDDRPMVRAQVSLAIDTGDGFEFTARIVRPDGEVRHVLSRGVTQQRDDASLSAVFGIFIDMTPQLEVEAELKRATERAETANCALQALAMEDSLTGLSNRRKFDEMIELEFLRAYRSLGSVGMIILDVDYFKQYNDIYGHAAGDQCLRAVAEEIGRNVKRRSTDLAARIGGEEFAIILCNTDEAGAMTVASQIVESVRALAIVHRGSGKCVITISAGVCVYVPTEELLTPAQLYEKADGALYKAKQAGRDGVVAHSKQAMERRAGGQLVENS